MTQLPHSPSEITKLVLERLPARRMRNVIEKRFGLKGGRMFTLEAIGKEYKITRERVRQIEADAMKRLAQSSDTEECSTVYQAIFEHIEHHGGLISERQLFHNLSEARGHAHIGLLLEIGKNFHRIPETDSFHHRWATSGEKAGQGEKVMNRVINDLNAEGRPVLRDDLKTIVSRAIHDELGITPADAMTESYLATSKLIQQNPYGEYGLASWPVINPRGVKDRAYVVFMKSAHPLHFREVANAINKVGWTKKKAHPQTVHNELIKDPRFVLVGRGLYALREWGYEEGPVRDVLASVFKAAQCPLSKEQVVEKVLAKRFVKEPTILLNLQNRKLFKKTDDGRYTLV